MTYYWVGGSGSFFYLDNPGNQSHWAGSSGGAPIPAAFPGSSDDCIIDANSFSADGGIITGALTCRNFDASLLNYTVTIYGASSQAYFEIYGNMTLSEKLTIGIDTNGFVVFQKTLGTQNLTCNGATINSILQTGFQGPNTITISLQDEMTAWEVYIQNSSTLTTNNNNVTCYDLRFSSGCTANYGSSTISAQSIYHESGSTVNAGTSLIHIPWGRGSIGGTNHTFYDLLIDYLITPATINTVDIDTPGCSFRNITVIGPAHKYAFLILYGNTAVTGMLSINGNSVLNRIFFHCYYEKFTITAATVSLSNTDFHHIGGSGAASPFTGTSLGDAGGVSGITFASPVTRYWVGNAGNWSDTAHWSNTSGGTGGQSVPLIHDNVVIDNNSCSINSQTIVLNQPRVCNNFTVGAGISHKPTLSFYYAYPYLSESPNDHRTYFMTGDIDFNSALTMVYSPMFLNVFLDNSESKTVESSGTYFNCGFRFFTHAGITGSISLVDDFSAFFLMLTGVPFDTGGSDIFTNYTYLNDEGPSDLSINNSEWECAGDGLFEYHSSYLSDGVVQSNTSTHDVVWKDNITSGTFNAGTSLIHITSHFSTHKEVSCWYLNDYYNITIETPFVDIHDQWKTANILTIKPGSHVQFSSEEEFIVNDLIANGKVNNPIIMHSNAEYDPYDGDEWYITKTSGTVNVRRCYIQDSIAGGGATFNAISSIDQGDNQGWNFISPIYNYFSLEGEPMLTGVYTLGRNSTTYPIVLDLTYPVSARNADDSIATANVEIGSIILDGNDMYVSWKHTVNGVETYGVDKLDKNNRLDGAYLETRVLSGNREQLGNFSKIVISYADLPDGTNIEVQYSKDYGEIWTTMTTKNDIDRKLLYCEEEFEASSVAYRAVITAANNDAPAIERIDVVLR